MQTLFVKNTLPVAANFTLSSPAVTTFNNIVGDAFSQQLVISLPFGRKLTVKTWSASGLPAGLSINPSTGLISGTFSSILTDTTSTVTISITSKQFSGTIAIPTQLTFVVKAYTAPVINSNQIFQQKTGVALSFIPAYSGTITSWSASGLPSGLSINSSTGAITGTYSGASGSYTVTITGSNASASASAAIIIQFPATSISISNAVYYFNYGVYTQVSTTLSSDAYVTSVNAATLPQGLSASVSNNVLNIQGIPRIALGAYTPTISFSNINGTYSQQITINVINGIPVIDTTQSPSVTYRSAVNKQLFLSQPNYTTTLNPVSGYDPTVTWKINGTDQANYSGLLGGLGITTGGLLTGTYNPTYAGAVAPTQFLLSVSAINYSGTGTASIPVNITKIAPSFKTSIPLFNSTIDSSINVLASDYIQDYPNIFSPVTSFGATNLLNGFSIDSTGRITGISNVCTTSQVKIATVAVNPGNGSTTIYQDLFGNISGGAPQISSKQTGISIINNSSTYQLSGSSSTCRQVTGWATNSLASGITLSSGDGVVTISSSTPIGIYKANVTGKNQFGSAATELTVNVNDYNSNLKFYKGEINRVVDSTSIIAGQPINTATCGRFLQKSNSNIFSDTAYFADIAQTVTQVTSNTGNYLMTYYAQVASTGCTGYSFTQPLYIYSELLTINSGNKITGLYNTTIDQSTGNSIIFDLNSGIRSISSVSFVGQDSSYVNSLGLTYRTGNGKLFIYAKGKGNKYNLNTTGDIITSNIYINNPIGKTSQYTYQFTGVTYASGITSVASTGQVYHVSNYSPTQTQFYPILLDSYTNFNSAPTNVIFDTGNSRFTSTIVYDSKNTYVTGVYLNLIVTGGSGIFSITGKYINNSGLTSISTKHSVHMYKLTQGGTPQLGSPKTYDTYYKTITGFVNSAISYTVTGLNIDPETVWTIGDTALKQFGEGYADDSKELYFKNSTDKYYNNYPTITGLPTKSIVNKQKVIQATNRFGTSNLYLDFKIDGYNPLSIPVLDVGIYNLYKNSEYVLISGGIGVILSSGGYYKGNAQAISAINAVKNDLSYYLSQNHVDERYVLPVTGGPTTGDALFTGSGIFAVYVVFGSDLSTSAYGQGTFYVNPAHLSSISGKMLQSMSAVTGWQVNDSGIIAKYGYFTGVAPTGATGNYLFEKIPVFSLSGFDNIKQNIYLTGFTGTLVSANGTYTLNADVTGLDSKYTQAVWTKGPEAFPKVYIPGPTTTGYLWSGENSGNIYKNAYEAGYRASGFITQSNTYFFDGNSNPDLDLCGSFPNYYPCDNYIIYQTPDKTWVRIDQKYQTLNVVNAVTYYNAFTFYDYGLFRINSSGNLATGTNGFSISGNGTNWRLLSGASVRGSGSGNANLLGTVWTFLSSGGALLDMASEGEQFIDGWSYWYANDYQLSTINISATGDSLTGVTWYNNQYGTTPIGKVVTQKVTELTPGTWQVTGGIGNAQAAGFAISYDQNRSLGIYAQRYFSTNTEPLWRIAYDTGTQPKAYNRWPWEASGNWSYDNRNIGYFSNYSGKINLIISGDNQSQTPVPDSATYSGLKLGDIPRFSMDTSGNMKVFIGGRFEGLSGATAPQISIKLADYYGRILKDELIIDCTYPDSFGYNGGNIISVSSKADDLSINDFIK